MDDTFLCVQTNLQRIMCIDSPFFTKHTAHSHHMKMCLMPQLINKPGHLCKLFNLYLIDSSGLNICLFEQGRLWLDCANAHANLNLRCSIFAVGYVII